MVDDRVAIDAGSLALNRAPHAHVRDIVITHPHMDHIASLPIFIDDIFATLEKPVCVYATAEVIELLERDIFNWMVYPRFSELSNDRTRVMEYVTIRPHEEFKAAHLRLTAINVSHVVPTVGLIFTDGNTTIAFSSDTSATDEFWQVVNRTPHINALLVEASFPNAMVELAGLSGHLTPEKLQRELAKLRHTEIDILAMHLKPSYRERLICELEALAIPRLQIMEPGREYSW